MEISRRITSRLLWTWAGVKLMTIGLPNRWKISWVPFAEEDNSEFMCHSLRAAGFPVEEISVDVDDFWRWVGEANYPQGSYADADYGRHVFSRKALEHYIATKLLQISSGDVYIDVASALSPCPDIIQRLYGCRVYRQDLIYPAGIHDNVIGSNAAAMPVPPSFASKMALHCSFEHFEGNCDTGFIREASRVLKPGGKMCIVPLYLFREYAIQTDPATWLPERPRFEPDATLYLARGFGNRWARFYDVQHFINRVVSNLNDLRLSVFFVRNDKDVHPSCTIKFVALFEKQA